MGAFGAKYISITRSIKLLTVLRTVSGSLDDLSFLRLRLTIFKKPMNRYSSQYIMSAASETNVLKFSIYERANATPKAIKFNPEDKTSTSDNGEGDIRAAKIASVSWNTI
ncbi:hypothetical protein OGATHE_004672 [Ogataea polymorpha]|uniref:Uncharacterized protein n=1 Tax=Ogataea polymorpha TaxID=460523 RepID=A0A9P8T2T4_9ASCO|nr:hypothetical protein OGATHE_004672 [Ogataea polymorpha]